LVGALDDIRVRVSERVGACAEGDHVCGVVDAPEQLADCITSWVRAGLEAGRRVVCVDRAGEPRYPAWLAEAGIDWAAAVDAGQLVLLPTDRAYLTDGVFDVERCLAQLTSFVEHSLAAGYPAVSMAADAGVAFEVFPDLDSVAAYEDGFEQLCRTYPVSGLCIYERVAFESALPTVARSHPRTVADDNFTGRVDGDRLRLTGELDLSSRTLLEALLATPPSGPDVVVDVRDVTFIDVAATAALVAAARRWAPRVRMRVLGASAQLRTIVSVGGWANDLDLIDEDR
jgi:anti-anti-sigma regulatory factor